MGNDRLGDPYRLIEELTDIGIALSAERNTSRLLELILDQAQRLSGADGGTLYLATERHTLRFEILHTGSLGLRLGGPSGGTVTLPEVPLRNDKGEPNLRMVAARAALTGQTVNIADIRTAGAEFDFSGTLEFDARTGYHSQSFLTVPMTNHEGEVIGVLQLLNAIDSGTGEVGPFSDATQRLVEALASQAAVALTNKQLIDAQKQLFDALIQLIANAIDEKSPYTAGHCRRVPVLTQLLAEAACRVQSGPLADFSMTEDERYELNVAAWLHDCGKITTPEYVVDKATKLQTIFDRIELVKLRLECLRRDARIRALEGQLQGLGGSSDVAGDEEYRQVCARLDVAREFLERVNLGGEFLEESAAMEVRELAALRWEAVDGSRQPLLQEEEVANLLVARGTLNDGERAVINNHVTVTIKMLESLPYPRHLKRVPEYAGGHHERMDGSGYPNRLTRAQMSIPARMMAIADIFEALTARDRPYKQPMSLSKSLEILGRMRLANHVDGDLFDVFVAEGVYQRYAQEFLDPSQIDEVDVSRIPGYRPPVASSEH
jgi:HD-GYP domain-containing protein (c-di-GMP phosphodiesterase class II)